MSEQNTEAVVLQAGDPVPFTYPEGFNQVVNSMPLPPEVAQQLLSALMAAIIIM